MNAHLIQTLAIHPALTLLPSKMNKRMAIVMLVSIGMQESRLKYRKQIKGPARGFWQFERYGGVDGVLHHHATAKHVKNVLELLAYSKKTKAREAHLLIQHNDVLAATFARLLLWSLPDALPRTAQQGWEQYLRVWRPGKPHPKTWEGFWSQAQAAVER